MQPTNTEAAKDKSPPAGSAISWLVVVPLAALAAVVFRLFVGDSLEVVRWNWVPSLGVDFSLRLDGLSLLFGLLISGVGVLIFVYASAYIGSHRDRHRLYGWLLIFMLAMLGVVFAENLLFLFVFWELTSITSYMLIGFKHESEKARSSALQALLVTGLGGLALLAGIVMVGDIVGSVQLTDVFASRELFAADPLANTALVLILLGVLTKSAQFPFHFWLPGAMVAPTPVSAYLHSATMVKAGVFLAARLHPLGSGISVWDNGLLFFGALTAIVGGVVAISERDLKRILAYSTVSSLGLMLMLLGIGTPLAVKSALLLLFCHSLYKAALFMVAGAIDAQLRTRDIRRLGGLAATMPVLAFAAALAALSQAGVPPAGGFLAKELTYETALDVSGSKWFILAAAFIANVTYVAVAGLVVVRPFFATHQNFRRDTGSTVDAALPLKEVPRLRLRLVMPSVLLGVIGLAPTLLGKSLFAPAYTAILPGAEPLKLKLWHGFNLPLLMSLLTIVAGIGVVLAQRPRRLLRLAMREAAPVSPTRIYGHCLAGLKSFAAWQTRWVQPNQLKRGILILLVAFSALVAYDFYDHVTVPSLGELLDIRLYELFVPALIVVAIGLIVTSNSRMAAVCGLGVIGYAIAILFVMYGAPDLAMTQFSIETLTVVLFVFVLARLPRFAKLSSMQARRRDIGVSIAGGAVMSAIAWAATAAHVPSRLSDFFAQNSLVQAKGRNLVNVILVDFRGLDTLGELVVLSVAAIGVFALLRIGREPDNQYRITRDGVANAHDVGDLPLAENATGAVDQLSKHFEAGNHTPTCEVPANRSNGSFRLLSSATNYMLPLLFLFAIFLLLRGHNEPGGGFVGGLVAAAAFALYAMTFGVPAARHLQGWPPRLYLATGLGLAVVAGLLGAIAGGSFLKGTWTSLSLPAIGKLGTPLLFDVGVCLVVIGMATMIVYELADSPIRSGAGQGSSQDDSTNDGPRAS
jgi:multicomponent Na+:H+ antiporter subunit A